MTIAKNTICLWYDKDAEAAARFYAEIFPDSSVSAVHRAPSDYPSGKAGDVLTVDSRSPRTISKRPTATGTPSSAMAVRKVLAVGARTNGASPGKSRRAC